MRRFSAVFLALVLVLSMALPAYAEESSDDIGQKLKELGEAIGEKAGELGENIGGAVSDFGDELAAFSRDPDGYIEQNEFLKSVRDKARELGKSMEEYWPTLKEAIVGSANTVIDSDMSWNEKKDALKQYAQLAIPYLKEAEFQSERDKARGAMEIYVELIEGALELNGSWDQKRELIALYGEQMNEQLSSLAVDANDEEIDAALKALTMAVQAENEENVREKLAEGKKLLGME